MDVLPDPHTLSAEDAQELIDQAAADQNQVQDHSHHHHHVEMHHEEGQDQDQHHVIHHEQEQEQVMEHLEEEQAGAGEGEAIEEESGIERFVETLEDAQRSTQLEQTQPSSEIPVAEQQREQPQAQAPEPEPKQQLVEEQEQIQQEQQEPEQEQQEQHPKVAGRKRSHSDVDTNNDAHQDAEDASGANNSSNSYRDLPSSERLRDHVPSGSGTVDIANSSKVHTGSGGPGGAVDSTGISEEEKKVRQREANRKAAERSRGKKKDELTNLEQTVSKIQAENTRLRTQLEALLEAARGVSTQQQQQSQQQPPTTVTVTVTDGETQGQNIVSAGPDDRDAMIDPALIEEVAMQGIEEQDGNATPSASASDMVPAPAPVSAAIDVTGPLALGAEGLNLESLKDLTHQIEVLKKQLIAKKLSTSASTNTPEPRPTEEVISVLRVTVDRKSVEKTALLTLIDSLQSERDSIESERSVLERELKERKAIARIIARVAAVSASASASADVRSQAVGAGTDEQGDTRMTADDGGDESKNHRKQTSATEEQVDVQVNAEELKGHMNVGVERALMEVRGWLDDSIKDWKKTGVLRPPPTASMEALPIPPVPSSTPITAAGVPSAVFTVREMSAKVAGVPSDSDIVQESDVGVHESSALASENINDEAPVSEQVDQPTVEVEPSHPADEEEQSEQQEQHRRQEQEQHDLQQEQEQHLQEHQEQQQEQEQLLQPQHDESIVATHAASEAPDRDPNNVFDLEHFPEHDHQEHEHEHEHEEDVTAGMDLDVGVDVDVDGVGDVDVDVEGEEDANAHLNFGQELTQSEEYMHLMAAVAANHGVDGDGQ